MRCSRSARCSCQVSRRLASTGGRSRSSLGLGVLITVVIGSVAAAIDGQALARAGSARRRGRSARRRDRPHAADDRRGSDRGDGDAAGRRGAVRPQLRRAGEVRSRVRSQRRDEHARPATGGSGRASRAAGSGTRCRCGRAGAGAAGSSARTSRRHACRARIGDSARRTRARSFIRPKAWATSTRPIARAPI